MEKPRKKGSGRYQLRQGDVMLVPISSIPKEAKNKAKSVLAPVTLALGEVTGHSHRFVSGRNVQLLELDAPMDGKAFGITSPVQRFVLAEKPDVLVHEEHEPVEVRKDNLGAFVVITPREYSPWGERRVVD
jgi:hypothetical protein